MQKLHTCSNNIILHFHGVGSVENLGEQFSLIQEDLEKVENGLKDFQGGVERHFKLQEKWQKQAVRTTFHV